MRALTLVTAAVLLEGCSPAQRTPAASGRADSGTARAETLVATPPPAMTERRAPQQNSAAQAFVGTWDFAPPAGQRGPHLSITVDSVRDNQIFGRITRALSGDMETSSMFAPFRGQVDQNGVARADIATREAQSRAVHVAGAIENGAWVLSSLVWGEEQAAPAGAKVWRGRKAQ